MFEYLTTAVNLILPEVVLLLAACVNLAVGPFLAGAGTLVLTEMRHRWGIWSLLALGTSGWFWLAPVPVNEASNFAPFQTDGLVWFVRMLTIATGAILVLTNWNSSSDHEVAESHACLLFISAGVNLIALANDLVVLFLALELVSIPTYMFLFVSRRDASGQEATVKYFLLSVFSSALVLYGFSFLYGVAGSTNLTAIRQAFDGGRIQPMPSVLLVSIVTIVAGLAFRVTAVPFHFYAPDVFQGTSNSAASVLSFVPKAAGFVALIRVLAPPSLEAAVPHHGDWSLASRSGELLAWLAIATMFLGNLLALLQRNVRRLLAYSSIAHAGYMLVGLTVAMSATPASSGTTTVQAAVIGGLPSLLFYLTVYGITTLGVFALVVSLSRPERLLERTDDLAGLGQTHPAGAFCLTVLLFGLTGLPPTAGFLGKLNLFLASWNHGSDLGYRLAVCLAVNAAIAAWYYLRLIGAMYLLPSRDDTRHSASIPAFIGVSVCAFASLALFFAPDWLWQALQLASR